MYFYVADTFPSPSFWSFRLYPEETALNYFLSTHLNLGSLAISVCLNVKFIMDLYVTGTFPSPSFWSFRLRPEETALWAGPATTRFSRPPSCTRPSRSS
jgi:hypothetical protein